MIDDRAAGLHGLRRDPDGFAISADDAEHLLRRLADCEEALDDAAATIEDMMSSTGGALVVQDYGRLNDVLVRQARLSAGRKEATR